jgi:hypothetical protein
MNTSLWYADGLRWIGSLFNGAADHFERAATLTANLDPRARSADEYLSEVRNRVHHF